MTMMLSSSFGRFFNKLSTGIGQLASRCRATSPLRNIRRAVTTTPSKQYDEEKQHIELAVSSSSSDNNESSTLMENVKPLQIASPKTAPIKLEKLRRKFNNYYSSFINQQNKSGLQTLGNDTTIAARRYFASYPGSRFKITQPKRGKNILLMGSPGAGKTSVAKQLARKLDMALVDVDDNLLEPTWNMPVADKLAEVGGKKFLDLEAEVFMTFKPVDATVISLTGSQPMNDDAMAYARKLGIIIYLDVLSEDILARLARMKVSRIIGQEKGIDMESILEYRKQFYERHYDIRLICEENESVASMTQKAVVAARKYPKDKGYTSTRARGFLDSFIDVTVQGLAPDRGLYVSNAKVPFMKKGQWQRLVGMPYNDCALKVLEQWLSPIDVGHKELRLLIDKAYTHENFGHEDIAPIVPLENNQYLLELFHGPTGSFKDIPLQLTARLFDYAVKRHNDGLRSLVLVATSGDTGGAVLNAFTRHTDRSEVVVLFPEEGVSAIQKAQLVGFQNRRSNVIGIKKNFDYCQTVVKDIFMDRVFDEKLRKLYGYSLSAANSINYARLLPQVVYHTWSYLLMVRDGHIKMGQPVDICVPTGNFGNILAAYYTQMMGIPFRRLVIASNSNNVLNEFFQTGVYDIGKRTLLTTLSPAIDILKSSNLERYLYLASGKDYPLMARLFNHLERYGKFSIADNPELLKKVQNDFKTGWCTDEESMKTIKDVFKRTGYMIDPHTAVAKTVADKLNLGNDVPVIISATAHYSKFSDTVLKAVGLHSETHTDNARLLMEKALRLTERPAKHKMLWEGIHNSRHHKTVCEGDMDIIRDNIEEFLYEYGLNKKSS